MAETASLIRINCIAEADRIALRQISTQSDQVVQEILDNKTGQILGTLTTWGECRHEVELFHGKGGFMVMLTSPKGLRYFVLPGSMLSLPGVELQLPGEPITANPQKHASPPRTVDPQQATRQATILGAGLATRFERISGESTHCAKPGVPLAGSATVIECIANGLAKHGFTHLIVNTYFKPASIKASLSRSAAQEVRYIDEEEPSGTAGGLRKMLLDPRFQGFLDESAPLLVVQGDAVTDADFSSLMAAHVAHQALVTIGCQLVAEEDVDKFGIIVTDQSGADGASGRITGFQEKPSREAAKSRLGNTGFYILSPAAYPIIREIYAETLARQQQQARDANQPVPSEVSLDFANDIFPAILARTQADPALGAFWAQSVGGYWNDIGNPRQYLESIHDIYAGKVDIPVPQNPEVYYRDGIIYWEGASAIAQEEGARLKGNIVVARPYSPGG